MAEERVLSFGALPVEQIDPALALITHGRDAVSVHLVISIFQMIDFLVLLVVLALQELVRISSLHVKGGAKGKEILCLVQAELLGVSLLVDLPARNLVLPDGLRKVLDLDLRDIYGGVAYRG